MTRKRNRFRRSSSTSDETGTDGDEMAGAHTKQHDYHLVDPSPWPIVGSISAFILAVGAITWMHKSLRRGAARVRGRRARRALHHGRLVARRDERGRASRRSHPRGADQPPLRHDPVHRLGSDVLRRLVLGLFQHRAVSRRRASNRAHRIHRRCLAAEGHRDLRSLASAAAQHADPADLRHHRDLGAPRAARRRPRRHEEGPVAHDRCSARCSPACRPTNTATPPSTSKATSTAPPSSWRPASTARMC